MNDGYGLCLNKWALDKDIKTELGLLIIISSLCAEKGYCFASNQYLSEIFDLPENTISLKIKKLEEKGYIKIIYEKRGCEITKRYIRIEKNQIDDLKKFNSTILKNSKDNNININNININIYRHYENIFSRTLNAIEYETMTNWLKDKTPEEIIEAINETAKANVDNIKYVEKVLYSKRKRKNPEWFNKTIESEELEPDKDFQDFLKEFRNE